MGDRSPDARVCRALVDEVFPAMLAENPAEREQVIERLLKLIAEQMANGRGMVVETPSSGALDEVDFSGVSVFLPGMVYTELMQDQHQKGAYYTPPEMARQVVSWAFGDHHARTRVLDPAMGSGYFLVMAGEAMTQTGADAAQRWDAAQQLYGIDRDPLAVTCARMTLWLWAGLDGTHYDDLGDSLICADTLIDDLPKAFPKAFDVVIGNPPYASVFTRKQTGDKAYAKSLQDRYETASGSFDLAVPFVEYALKHCQHMGRVGFVLPNKLLAADYARELRQWVNENAVIELIVDFSEAMPFAADVYPVVLVMRRDDADPDEAFMLAKAQKDGAAPEVIRQGRQSELCSVPGGGWSALLDPAWDDLKKCFTGGVLLGAIAELSAGLSVGEAYDLRERVIDAPFGAMPPDGVRLITSGSVRRHKLLWGEKDTRFLKGTYHYPAVMVTALSERRRAQVKAQKIIVSGMGLEPRACVERGLALASVSTVVIMDAQMPIYALCAILNSSLMARIYRALFGGLALSGGYLRFGKRELAVMPVPDVGLDDPRIKRLAELGEAISRADKIGYADLDAQIDRLVDELYGFIQSSDS